MVHAHAALALCALLLACSGAPQARKGPPLREWTLVYHLPYDNDLARNADPILDALESGLEDERVAVLALVDRPGPGGTERVILTRDGRHEHSSRFEASAHPAVLGRLLDLAVAKLPARHYALFLLDHGGKLDEIGLDLHPAGGPSWMPARGAAEVLAAWRARHGRRLDLFMLQQCGRGSMETHHLFREEADVIVASQGLLEAPNGYYTPMLRAIGRGEVEDGEALARVLIDAEPARAFVEYTAVRGPALEALPAELDRALAPLLAAVEVSAGAREAAAHALALVWEDEAYVDLTLFLRALYAAQALDPAPLDALARFLTERVIVHRRRSPAAPHAAHLSGLSMLVPTGAGVLERYADLPLYRESGLEALLRRYPQELPADVALLPGHIAPTPGSDR